MRGRLIILGAVLAAAVLVAGVESGSYSPVTLPGDAWSSPGGFLVTWGRGGAQAYIGDDGIIGFGSYVDVNIGAFNPSVRWVTLYNMSTGRLMNLDAQDGYFWGDLTVRGTKSFVLEDPQDPQKEIVYSSLEGPEVGTYIRGTAELQNDEAVIELPEHFAKVTAEEGLTVQLTPVGQWLQLFIVEKSTHRIVVREANGRDGQFDYLVQGVRKGYEDYQVVRDVAGERQTATADEVVPSG